MSCWAPGGDGAALDQQRLAVVGGVADRVDTPVRKLLGEKQNQLTRQLDRRRRRPGRARVATAPASTPDARTNGSRTRIPAITHRLPRPSALGSLPGPVVGPERAEHRRPPAAEQRVVDHHDDRRTRIQQPIDDQPGQHQPI